MPDLIFAGFAGVLPFPGKRFPGSPAEIAGRVSGRRRRFVIDTRHVNRLAAIALDPDICNAPAIPLHREMRLAVLLLGKSPLPGWRRRGIYGSERLWLLVLRDDRNVEFTLFRRRSRGQ